MLKKLLLTSALMAICAIACVAQDNNQNRDRGSQNGQRGPGGDRNQRWDPAQFQERMMQGYKERLEIKDDAEWKAIQPLVEKVQAAQRQVLSDRMPRFGRRPGGDDRQGDRRGMGMFGGGQPSPEMDALQRAVDAKASKAELKAALEKVAAARKARMAELEAAQENLRKVLTPDQEARATLAALL